jgi:hypothetical protein
MPLQTRETASSRAGGGVQDSVAQRRKRRPSFGVAASAVVETELRIPAGPIVATLVATMPVDSAWRC